MVFISPRISATSHCINMVQRRYLTDVDRGRAIAWLQQRIAVREVARRLGMAPSVICRLQQRWQATGKVQDRPRSGRPRKATRQEDRYITRQATMARTSTARRIRGQLRAATQTNVSVSTIKNRLHEVRLHARLPVKRPKLTHAYRRAHLAWCRRHVRWAHAHWSRVMFTDESRFALEHPDGHTKVWRREGERFLDECVLPVTGFGGSSIMVWAGFSAHHRTRLHHVQGNLNGQRYRDEILHPHAVPMLRRIGQGAVYQDDNAQPHRAGLALRGGQDGLASLQPGSQSNRKCLGPPGETIHHLLYCQLFWVCSSKSGWPSPRHSSDDTPCQWDVGVSIAWGQEADTPTIDCFHELKWTRATFANFENVPIVTKVLINLEPEIKMSWNFVCMGLNVKPNFG